MGNYNSPTWYPRDEAYKGRDELWRIRISGERLKNCFLTSDEYVRDLIKEKSKDPYKSKKRPYKEKIRFMDGLPDGELCIGIDSFEINWIIIVVNDMRFRPSFIHIYGNEIEDYIKEFKKCFGIYESMDKSDYIVHKSNMGITIHSNGDYSGVCLDYNEFRINSIDKLNSIINGLEYAKQRARDLQAEIKSGEEPNKYNDYVLEYTKNYIRHAAHSEQETKRYLEKCGFVPSSIQYALNNSNINWDDQALRSVEDKIKHYNATKKDMIKCLERHGYTKYNIDYVLKKLRLECSEETLEVYENISIKTNKNTDVNDIADIEAQIAQLQSKIHELREQELRKLTKVLSKIAQKKY